MRMYYLFFIFLFFTISCKEEERGEPAIFENYFQIVDAATGKDWFLTHSDYHLDSVKLSAYDEKDSLVELPLYYKQIGDKIAFGPLLWISSRPEETRYLLQLSADDADTLQWVGKKCDGCQGKYLGYESFSFYYNDKLAVYLDFHLEDDTKAEDWIIHRLTTTNRTLTDSTYVMTFEKVAE